MDPKFIVIEMKLEYLVSTAELESLIINRKKIRLKREDQLVLYQFHCKQARWYI